MRNAFKPKYCRHCYSFLPVPADVCPSCQSHDLLAIGGPDVGGGVFSREAAEQLVQKGHYREALKLCVDSGFNDCDSNYMMAVMLLKGRFDSIGPDVANGWYVSPSCIHCMSPYLLKVVGPHFKRALLHLEIAKEKGLSAEKLSALRTNYVWRGIFKAGWIWVFLFSAVFDLADVGTRFTKIAISLVVVLALVAGLIDYPYISIPIMCLVPVGLSMAFRFWLFRHELDSEDFKGNNGREVGHE